MKNSVTIIIVFLSLFFSRDKGRFHIEKNNLLKQGMVKKDGSPYVELVNTVTTTNRTAKELFELNLQ
ncbi:MAG: hypothetical protein CMC56_04810 [Flavobacteriaceae bacterium]|nr:hypothetical protein [Flavobacteriaceae bacterium]